MISALTEQSSVVRCIERGAEDYLPKPFEPVLLEARIGACLEKKAAARPGGGAPGRDRTAAEASGRAPARDLAGGGSGRAQGTGRVRPRRFEEVAVMFVDLVGFTAWCDAHPPEEVVANVQRLAESASRSSPHRHGMEKIKTIGDAFMATANLLLPHADPVMAASAAPATWHAARACPSGWGIRAGIHIGPVVAGVVGPDEVQLRPVGRHRQRGGAAFRARQRGRHLPFSGRFRAGARPLHGSGGRAGAAQG